MFSYRDIETVPEVKVLATQAESRNVTILPEFGLDPGIDLVMLGEAVRSLDEVEEIWSYGGGIPEPEAASNPLKYKVTWTFEGVLNSYRRAGKVIRDGRIVQIESAFSQPPLSLIFSTAPTNGTW